jgi:glycosyltransferase involved in cell wall biosynthesis
VIQDPAMQIGIDARELLGRPTGVGRYLAELLQRWAEDSRAASHRFLLYSPRPLGALLDVDVLGAAIRSGRLATRVIPGSSSTYWEQARLARAVVKDRLDVFFAPGYTAPIATGSPLVVAIHDVSFAAHPEWFPWREGIRRRGLSRLAARRASVILTLSEFSRSEIAHHLGAPPDRIRVTPLGCAARFDGAPSTSRAPLVLFVGSIFNRRRLPDLIEAFRIVLEHRSDAHLAIVGENRTHPHQDLAGQIAAAGIAGRVTLANYVADDELARLYRSASVFAFLSEYEGFGLTPLEAIASGVPPVLLDTAVAREVFGDAALLVPKGDVPRVAEALVRLLDDAPLRASLGEAGARLLERYSWSRTAEAVLQALEHAATFPRP